jgi:hypothetical protein
MFPPPFPRVCFAGFSANDGCFCHSVSNVDVQTACERNTDMPFLGTTPSKSMARWALQAMRH